MTRFGRILTVVAVLGVVVAAACGAAPPAAEAAGGGSSHTYTIGLLTDATGLAASSNKTSVLGVRAGLTAAAHDGYHFKLVVADTDTNPDGVLPAAQRLVDEDHVFAVVSVSALAFAAAPYLTAHGIPVVGFSGDGPEWITAKNMFSVVGKVDTQAVSTLFGVLMKKLGATDVAAVGYGASPVSNQSARADAVSAQLEGLKVGYLDSDLPIFTTDVEPNAIAMKNNGVNGYMSVTAPNTSLALYQDLENLGVHVKVALLAQGYGGDLLQSGPNAIATAQGAYAMEPFEPMELHTAATRQFAAALKQVGVTGDPTSAEYYGYTSVDLLIRGLQAAGADPTQAQFISALRKVHNFNGFGLLGRETTNMSSNAPVVFGADNCLWLTKVAGRGFQLVPGAEPICGALVKGRTISAT